MAAIYCSRDFELFAEFERLRMTLFAGLWIEPLKEPIEKGMFGAEFCLPKKMGIQKIHTLITTA